MKSCVKAEEHLEALPGGLAESPAEKHITFSSFQYNITITVFLTYNHVKLGATKTYIFVDKHIDICN